MIQHEWIRTSRLQTLRERVLFIGTQFSNLYTVVDICCCTFVCSVEDREGRVLHVCMHVRACVRLRESARVRASERLCVRLSRWLADRDRNSGVVWLMW